MSHKLYKKSLLLAIEKHQQLTSTQKTQQQYHFAFLWDGNNLIATGTNNPKNHPVVKKFYRSAVDHIHAELAVLLRARKIEDQNLSKTVLVVIRLSKKLAKPNMSKPCPGCMTAINFYGIKKVIYSITDHEYGTIYIK